MIFSYLGALEFLDNIFSWAVGEFMLVSIQGRVLMERDSSMATILLAALPSHLSSVIKLYTALPQSPIRFVRMTATIYVWAWNTYNYFFLHPSYAVTLILQLKLNIVHIFDGNRILLSWYTLVLIFYSITEVPSVWWPVKAPVLKF